MLRREHDLRRGDGLAVGILDRHLALGVGAELGGVAFARVAGLGEDFENLVRIIERRRHQLRRFAAGIAEHDALVARAFVLVAGGIDALRDIGRLRVQQNFELGSAPNGSPSCS